MASEAKEDCGEDPEQEEGGLVPEDPAWGLPPPLTSPPPEKVTPNSQKLAKVFFDLETTGGDTEAHITQISAVSASDDDSSSFDCYVLPKIPVEAYVSKNITHQTLENGRLHHKGEPVEAQPLKRALQDFLSYLGQVSLSYLGQVRPATQCLLIAHGCISADSQVLTKCLEKCGLMNQFMQVCAGFSDSLSVFMDKFPERKEEKKKYGQEALYKDFIGDQYEAHSSIEDSKALKKLCKKAAISDTDFLEHSRTVVFIKLLIETYNKKRTNQTSLKELVAKRVISKKLARTMASRGYNLEVLKDGYDRDILNNILLARITKRDTIAKRITEYFKESKEDS